MVTIFFTGTKLLLFDVLPHEPKVHQDYRLAMTVAGSSKDNTDAKRRVGKNQQVAHMNNSGCRNRLFAA
jgi:hypothetical protein